MAPKDIKFKEEARQKILKGVRTLSSAVKVTYQNTYQKLLGRIHMYIPPYRTKCAASYYTPFLAFLSIAW